MSWNLDAAVGELTRPTRHRIVDPATGRAQWVIADPLLVQLVQAIANSGGSTAFKSSGGVSLPISAGALDLYQEIEKTTAEQWWACHLLHHGQGRGTLAGRLRAWSMAARANQDALREAEEIICGWVRSITGLLQPQRTREIIGACPGCKQARYRSRNEDGEVVNAPVLALVYDSDGRPDRVVCHWCKQEWQGHDIYVLARIIGGQDGSASNVSAV